HIEDYLSGASRQSESREIVADVEKTLTTTDLSNMDYGIVTQLTQRLTRALQLWPENLKAESIRQSILVRHAQLAFDAGDLQLAYSLAGSLTDDDARDEILRKINIARQRKERHAF